ncbi:MAG: hypothetical protein ACYCW6_13260, partial [Candidatus Xenobia bacterium]
MSWEVERPVLLGLLLLAAPLVWWWLHSRVELPRPRRIALLVLRLTMLVLLVLALAGLRLRVPTDRLCVLFVVDHSDSISKRNQLWARDLVARATAAMGSNDGAGL